MIADASYARDLGLSGAGVAYIASRTFARTSGPVDCSDFFLRLHWKKTARLSTFPRASMSPKLQAFIEIALVA